MRSFAFLGVLLLALGITGSGAHAGGLRTYDCYQIDSRITPRKVARGAWVTVQELQELRRPQGLDNLYRVDVTVGRFLANGERQTLQHFEARAAVSDVLYTISSVRTNRVHFRMYLDEMDQSSLRYVAASGTQRSVRLNCEIR